MKWKEMEQVAAGQLYISIFRLCSYNKYETAKMKAKAKAATEKNSSRDVSSPINPSKWELNRVRQAPNPSIRLVSFFSPNHATLNERKNGPPDKIHLISLWFIFSKKKKKKKIKETSTKNVEAESSSGGTRCRWTLEPNFFLLIRFFFFIKCDACHLKDGNLILE